MNGQDESDVDIQGANIALQAQLDDVGEALGSLLGESDGYHGTAVRSLIDRLAQAEECLDMYRRCIADDAGLSIEAATAERIAAFLEAVSVDVPTDSLKNIAKNIRAWARRNKGE